MSVAQTGDARQFYIHRPSFQPLKLFHGYFIRSFSSLPEKGKLLEVVKRICLICVAPFAYLALSCVALLGVLCSKVQYNESPRPFAEAEIYPGTHSQNVDRLIRESARQIDQSATRTIEDNQISNFKVLVLCKQDHQTHKFEIDLSSREGVCVHDFEQSVMRLHQRMKRWFVNSSIGNEGTKIEGHAIGLADEDVYVADWTAQLSTAEAGFSINGDSSTLHMKTGLLPDFLAFLDFLIEYINQMTGEYPDLDQVPNSLFESRVFPDADYEQRIRDENRDEAEFLPR